MHSDQSPVWSAIRQSHFISCFILHMAELDLLSEKAEGNFVNVLLCWIEADFFTCWFEYFMAFCL